MLLLGEFRTALAVFLFAIIGGGALYYTIAARVGEPVQNLSEAIYIVLTLAFLQPSGDFPHSPYLEAFFFFMPLYAQMIESRASRINNKLMGRVKNTSMDPLDQIRVLLKLDSNIGPMKKAITNGATGNSSFRIK